MLQKIEEDTKEESGEDDDDDDEIDEDPTDEDDEDENKAPPKPIPDSMSFTQDFSARPPENLSPPSVPAFQAETHHFPSMSAPFVEPYIRQPNSSRKYIYPSTVAFDADDYMDTYPDAWEHTDVEMGDAFPTHELDPFAMDTSESRAVDWGFLNVNSNWQRNQHRNQHADHHWEQHHEQDRKAEPQPSRATRTLFPPITEDTPAQNEPAEAGHKVSRAPFILEFSKIDASTPIVQHLHPNETQICRDLRLTTICRAHPNTDRTASCAESCAFDAGEVRSLYPDASCKSLQRTSLKKSDKFPEFLRGAQIPGTCGI